jgi:hypothetical protein
MDMTYKTYDTPDGERDPTAQDTIKPKNHSMKGHITGGDDKSDGKKLSESKKTK